MLKTWEIRTSSEQETIQVGSAIGKILRPGDVILLEGELGSGKTRLAKGIVSTAAGVPQDDVVSPTFTLMNTFEGAFPVHHADLYRINADQVEGIGIEEAVEDGPVVIEWAEKAVDLADDPLRIVITSTGEDDSRLISLEWNDEGSWVGRMQEALNRLSKALSSRIQ